MNKIPNKILTLDTIGTGFKTINGNSILGAGDLEINQSSQSIPYNGNIEGTRVSLGYRNSGDGNGVVIGFGNNGSGWNWSTAVGRDNTVTGYYAQAMGINCKAEATKSSAFGVGAKTHIDSSFVFGIDSYLTNSTKVSQTSILIMKCTTTDITPALLKPAIAVGMSQKDYFEILINSTTSFSGEILGTVNGNESVSFNIEGLIQCGDTIDTCTLIGSTVTPKFGSPTLSGCDISIEARTDTNRLEIFITGISGKTIYWNGFIHTNEVR